MVQSIVKKGINRTRDIRLKHSGILMDLTVATGTTSATGL